MTNPVFFPQPAALSVTEIARLTEARPVGGDPHRLIAGASALAGAGPSDVSFFESTRHADALAATLAGACFCTEKGAQLVPAATVALVTARPHEAFAEALRLLYPAAARPRPVFEGNGVSPAAHVDAKARIELGATVEAGASIGAEAEIGRGSLISVGAVIGPGVRVGRDASVGPNAVIVHALIGDRVIVHAGACIGQDGFGFIPGRNAPRKIPQIGRVIVQDDVEIGANTTIDRGSIRDTVVGEGTKIDNLVQIAHNVVIGRNCLIAAHVGVAGSATIGDFVMLGGKVGVRDNITIGRGAILAASSSVAGDVPEGARWGGTPAKPINEWLRETVALRRQSGKGRGGSRKEDTPHE